MLVAVVKVFRAILHVLTALCLVAALVFVSLAAGRPDWQIMEPSKGQEYRHRHGLWEDCIMKPNEKQAFRCTLKNFDMSQEQARRLLQEESTVTGDVHIPRRFQLQTLALLITGCSFTFFSIIFCIISCYSDCMNYRPVFKGVAVAWLVCHTIAAIMVSAALIVFARHTYDVEERAVKIYTEYIDQVWGISFWHGVIGCCALLGTWIAALVCVIGIYCLAAGTARHDRKHTYERVERAEGKRQLVDLRRSSRYSDQDYHDEKEEEHRYQPDYMSKKYPPKYQPEYKQSYVYGSHTAV